MPSGLTKGEFSSLKSFVPVSKNTKFHPQKITGEVVSSEM